MESLLLAATENVINYILIGIVVLMLIALPIMMNQKNKRETQKIQEQTNSLKVGDKVLTTSGVYGTITELKFDETQKLVVIETGGKTKSYMTVDAYAIYTVFKSEEELKKEQEARELAEKAKEDEKKAKHNKESAKEETTVAEEVKVEETKKEPKETEAEVVEPEKKSKKKAK